MSTRVYFNLKGLSVQKYPNGDYWVEILVDEVLARQNFDYYNGRFFITYREDYCVIPKALGGRVSGVTRLKTFEAMSCHKQKMAPGNYCEQEERFKADITEVYVSGHIGLSVEVAASNLKVLATYWPKLLAGELVPKHQYQPSNKSRPFALAARKE